MGTHLGPLRGRIRALDPRMKETLGATALLCLKLLAEREFSFVSRLYLLWSSSWQLFTFIITKIRMNLLGKIPRRSEFELDLEILIKDQSNGKERDKDRAGACSL